VFDFTTISGIELHVCDCGMNVFSFKSLVWMVLMLLILLFSFAATQTSSPSRCYHQSWFGQSCWCFRWCCHRILTGITTAIVITSFIII
jgi:hypothetical protein